MYKITVLIQKYTWINQSKIVEYNYKALLWVTVHRTCTRAPFTFNKKKTVEFIRWYNLSHNMFLECLWERVYHRTGWNTQAHTSTQLTALNYLRQECRFHLYSWHPDTPLSAPSSYLIFYCAWIYYDIRNEFPWQRISLRLFIQVFVKQNSRCFAFAGAIRAVYF